LKDVSIDKQHCVVLAIKQAGEMNQHYFKRTRLQQRHLHTFHPLFSQSVDHWINEYTHPSIHQSINQSGNKSLKIFTQHTTAEILTK